MDPSGLRKKVNVSLFRLSKRVLSELKTCLRTKSTCLNDVFRLRVLGELLLEGLG